MFRKHHRFLIVRLFVTSVLMLAVTALTGRRSGTEAVGRRLESRRAGVALQRSPPTMPGTPTTKRNGGISRETSRPMLANRTATN